MDEDRGSYGLEVRPPPVELRVSGASSPLMKDVKTEDWKYDLDQYDISTITGNIRSDIVVLN